MTILEKVTADFQPVIEKFKAAVADGKIDGNEIFGLLISGIKAIVALLDDFSDLTPEQAKTIGLQLVDQFYQDVIAPIDLPGVPNIIEPYVDSLGKTLILTGVEKLFDAIQASNKIDAVVHS